MNSCVDLLSPPAWWCGLKLISYRDKYQSISVTTCVVVWIEMFKLPVQFFFNPVTTCVVVWIEILNTSS